MPEVHRSQFFAEIRASTFYVENWQLAHTAVDYFAADEGPSPVQHFWSLSAEEQFYLVWPVLILAAAAIGLRARSRRRVFAALAAVTAGSLAYSIYKTGADPAAAYFVTPTRAWEFGLGGLLAFAASERPRASVAVAGLVAVAVAAATFSADTAFPGVAALLPVLGACAVIWARAPLARPHRPPRAVRGRHLLRGLSVALVAARSSPRTCCRCPAAGWSCSRSLLAAATKRWVEDPIRRGRVLLARPPRWTLVSAGVATALVIGLTLAGTAQVERNIEVAQRASKVLIAAAPALLRRRLARRPGRARTRGCG